MADIMKHMGFTNTGSKVAVVFPSIPGKEDYCLVVETDALPPKFSDAFQNLLQLEAQNTADTLDSLLSRRRFSNSTADSMLMELHLTGNLVRIPIANVTMNVTRSQTMPLQDIVDAMAGKTKEEVAPPVVPQTVNIDELSDVEQAKNLLMQSQLLAKDADDLKEQAYTLDPTLKPKKRGRKPAVKKEKK